MILKPYLTIPYLTKPNPTLPHRKGSFVRNEDDSKTPPYLTIPNLTIPNLTIPSEYEKNKGKNKIKNYPLFSKIVWN